MILSGVIITVCHDRYFLDRVVDKLFVFMGNGRIDIVHGSYSDYKADIGESNNSPFYVPEQQHSNVHSTEASSDSTDTIGASSSTESSHTESPVKKALIRPKRQNMHRLWRNYQTRTSC